MILITGGAGYIGSHVNKLLNQSGYETVVLDNLSYGYKDFVKWGEFVEGNISDEDILDYIFEMLPQIHLFYEVKLKLNQIITF